MAEDEPSKTARRASVLVRVLADRLYDARAAECRLLVLAAKDEWTNDEQSEYRQLVRVIDALEIR